MKHFLKTIVVTILSKQVRLLRKKHDFKVIGVVGGIGKTSTKTAIAQALSTARRVRYQAGNYNDIVSVPLIFFGHSLPSLYNPFAWLAVFIRNAWQIYGNYPFDVVVVELGTDRVGQIAEFQKYLSLDYAVVTAIVPEHMQYFHDIQTVAKEELSVAAYTQKLIYNADLVPHAYRQQLQNAISYGNAQDADYRLAGVRQSAEGMSYEVMHSGEPVARCTQDAVSETQLYSGMAAAVIGKALGLSASQITTGVAAIHPVSGRLARLRGLNDSLIIDDTYNAMPDAMRASILALYKLTAPQKIAILGSMNQLGDISGQVHKEIGGLCDPQQLDIVVTVGQDAKTYLAPAARARGCNVISFNRPQQAGIYLQSRIEKNAIILAKGSEAGVFTEEAVKFLLADPADAAKLVRQSPQWMSIKKRAFAAQQHNRP